MPKPTEVPFSPQPGSQLPATDHTSHGQVFPPSDPEGRRDCQLLLSPWGSWFYHGGAEENPQVPPDDRTPQTGQGTAYSLVQSLTLTAG